MRITFHWSKAENMGRREKLVRTAGIWLCFIGCELVLALVHNGYWYANSWYQYLCSAVTAGVGLLAVHGSYRFWLGKEAHHAKS